MLCSKACLFSLIRLSRPADPCGPKFAHERGTHPVRKRCEKFPIFGSLGPFRRPSLAKAATAGEDGSTPNPLGSGCLGEDDEVALPRSDRGLADLSCAGPMTGPVVGAGPGISGGSFNFAANQPSTLPLAPPPPPTAPQIPQTTAPLDFYSPSARTGCSNVGSVAMDRDGSPGYRLGNQPGLTHRRRSGALQSVGRSSAIHWVSFRSAFLRFAAMVMRCHN